MQRYMYHLVAARETTASLSKLAAWYKMWYTEK